MTNRKLLFALLTILTFGTSAPAQAQVALFDVGRLERACLDSFCDENVAQIAKEIKGRNLDQAILNSQLGLVAAILLDAGRALPPRASKHIASGIAALAEYSTDPAQKKAFRSAGLALERGDADLFATSEPFAVSPDRTRYRGIRGKRGDARKRRQGQRLRRFFRSERTF